MFELVFPFNEVMFFAFVNVDFAHNPESVAVHGQGEDVGFFSATALVVNGFVRYAALYLWRGVV